MDNIDFEKNELLPEAALMSIKKNWGECEWCDYLGKKLRLVLRIFDTTKICRRLLI